MPFKNANLLLWCVVSSFVMFLGKPPEKAEMNMTCARCRIASEVTAFSLSGVWAAAGELALLH